MPRLVSKKSPIYPELAADATREMEAAGLNKTTWYEASGVARQTIKDFTNGVIAPGPDVMFRLAIALFPDRDPVRAQAIVERWQRLKALRKAPAGAPGGGAPAPTFQAAARGGEPLAPLSAARDRSARVGRGVEAPARAVAANEDAQAWRGTILARVERLAAYVEAELEEIKRAITPPYLQSLAPLDERQAA